MTESPLKFSFSHDFLKSISLSSGQDILSVFDNMKIEDAQIDTKEGQTLFFRDISISHLAPKGDFKLLQTFDSVKNQMKLEFDESSKAGF